MSVAKHPTETSHAVPCANCGGQLPLRNPVDAEEARDWICTGCQEIQSGLLDAESPSELRRNVRPTAISFDESKKSDSVEQILGFVRQLPVQEGNSIEKRSVARHFMNAPALAVPVDEQFRAAGETIQLVSRDISRTGIALIHTESIEEKYLALELEKSTGGKIQVVMEVTRCRPLGDYCDIAGRFVTKMGE